MRRSPPPAHHYHHLTNTWEYRGPDLGPPPPPTLCSFTILAEHCNINILSLTTSSRHSHRMLTAVGLQQWIETVQMVHKNSFKGVLKII